MPNFTLVCLPSTQCSQNSNLHAFAPFNKPCFTNPCNAFSPACPRRICHNLVLSASAASVTAAPPITVLPCKKYKLFRLVPFITTSAPCTALRTPPSMVILRPLDSKAPNEMRFFFISGTYRTSLNSLTVPSCIFKQILPIPCVLQALLLPIKTTPPSSSSKLENHSRIGHI